MLCRAATAAANVSLISHSLSFCCCSLAVKGCPSIDFHTSYPAMCAVIAQLLLLPEAPLHALCLCGSKLHSVSAGLARSCDCRQMSSQRLK